MAGLSGIRSVCAVLILISTPWLLAGINGWSGNGPYGGTIGHLAVHPQRPGIVYASTWERGIFKSTDGGLNWFSVSIPAFEEDTVVALFIDPFEPDHVYAHTGYNGLYESANGGEEWTWISYGPYDWTEYMTAHPYKRGVLFGSVAYGLYRSTDGGESWEDLSSVQTVICMAFDPRDPEVLWAGTWDNGLLRSSDGGLNWTDTGPGLPSDYVTALACLPEEPDTLYAAVGWEIYKTTDQGQSWSLSRAETSQVETWQISPDPSAPGRVYAATLGAGVFRTDDGGGVWHQLNDGLGDLYLSSVVLDSSGEGATLVGAQGSGVYRSENHGGHWSHSSQGLEACLPTAVAFDPHDPTRLFAACWGQGIYLSSDSGLSWWTTPSLLSGQTMRCLALDPLQPGLLYAGTSGRGVLVSTDSGIQWAATDASLDNRHIRCLALNPQAPATIYAGCSNQGSQIGGIFKTTNAGASWTRLFSSATIYALEIDPQSPDTLWAYEEGMGLGKSTDGGIYWQSISLGVGYYPLVLAIAVNPLNGQEVYAGVYDHGLFKTVDGGTVWNQIDDGVTRILDIVVDPSDPQTVCIGGEDGIRLSRDGGMTWAPIGASLPSSLIACLAVDPRIPGRFIAGVDSYGVFELQISSDLNLDGEVSEGDVDLLRAFLVENTAFLAAGPTASDIDLDGRTTVRDLLILQQSIRTGERAPTGAVSWKHTDH